MTELQSQLESHLGHSYTIERELAGGGMARVFVATERALGRRVVIKLLSPELAAEVSTKRFEREIKLAASLQQANIVPVLSAGEADGLAYYTMPFVEGLSLRERLARGKPDLRETISILRDLARALAYAHEHNVVHRDIKPENVLLSGDAVVVTDFGIARAIASSRLSVVGSHSVEITMAGVAVGTPAYMAPEQITMDPSIDHRADLYAFGCVAYELLCGAPPFVARTTQALFASHLSETPVPVVERSSDAPPELATLVMRCLEKDPALRPQSAREVLSVLESTTSGAAWTTRLARRLSKRQRRALAAALVVLALGAALLARSSSRQPATLATIAVLPFLNVGNDSANEYLADGVADELATALGKIPGVRMVARTSAYRYKGQRDVDASEIGKTLSASHVLHGSIQRSGGALRVSAQLLDAHNNQELWADIFNGSSSDAFAVENEIATRISAALSKRIGLAAATLPPAAMAGTSNADAYDLYLRGRFLLLRRGPGVRQAVVKFAEAIAKDSTFARAYAALALAQELVVYFEPVRTDSVGKLAIPAARRALALDSTLGEAHSALALAYTHAYRWGDAEAEHRLAVASSNEPDPYIQYGRLLFYTGRFREAQRQFDRARQVDPYSSVASAWVGHLLYLSGRRAEGMAEMRRALEIDSTNPPALVVMAHALWSERRIPEARALAERLWQSMPSWRNAAAAIFAQIGDRERAMTFVRAMEASPREATADLWLPSVYACLGDSARLFQALERATAARLPWPTYHSLSEPQFDFVRRSAHFAAIIRSVGLDDRVFMSPTGGRPQ